jgi:hypothetical protein
MEPYLQSPVPSWRTQGQHYHYSSIFILQFYNNMVIVRYWEHAAGGAVG